MPSTFKKLKIEQSWRTWLNYPRLEINIPLDRWCILHLTVQIENFSAGTVERIGSIMKIIYQKETAITEEDMIEITAVRQKLFGENCYCTLIDLTQEFLSLTPEAKKYGTENPSIKRLRIAEVLLVKNFAQKLGVHTYVKIFRSKDNVKVMTNELEAIQWLNLQYNLYFKKEAV